MNEEYPLISIAISTYNGGKFLEMQLESLLKQTYPHLEIVIVDDCSTDSTISILEEYQRENLHIKIFLNPQNLGFNKSFERAFSLCKGEYIAISDQDDSWFSNKIERLYNQVGNNLLIYSNSILIEENGKELGRSKFKKILPARNDPRAFSIRNTVSGHTVLFRRELLDYVLPIPPNCYYDWWMALVAANKNGITSIDECLTKHRIHVANASQGCEATKDEKYASMRGWIISVLTLKDLRHRHFFEDLLKILSMEDENKRDKSLIKFQLVNRNIIYNKKGWFSKINNARKIVLSIMPKR